ncbi:MAG: hypothetical protein AAFO70_03020, partial [Pseudomonadota bacterium]
HACFRLFKFYGVDGAGGGRVTIERDAHRVDLSAGGSRGTRLCTVALSPASMGPPTALTQ